MSTAFYHIYDRVPEEIQNKIAQIVLQQLLKRTYRKGLLEHYFDHWRRWKYVEWLHKQYDYETVYQLRLMMNF